MWLCALIVTLSLGETRAENFFATPTLELEQNQPQTQASTREITFAYGYDASDYALAPKNAAGKLIYDKAAKSWTSPNGLIYGQGSKHGNRVKHVLDHAAMNAKKKLHSVFNVDRNKVIGLVDDAWAKRGSPLPNDPGVYIVPMGRAVGTAGETSVKIVVRSGTNQVITAFPFK